MNTDTSEPNTTNIKQPETFTHKACECGCSEIVIPSHMKDENLYLTIRPIRTTGDYVRVKVTYEKEQDNKGWK